MYFSPKTSADGLVFHYDTGNTVRSYLGEPTVNLHPNSEDVSSWTGNLFGNWIQSAVTSNAVVAPNGTLTGDRVGDGYGRFNVSATTTPSQAYTYSVYLKNVSLANNFYIAYAWGLNGTLVSYGNALLINVGTLSTLEWTRFTFTLTAPSSGINQMQFGPCPFTGYGNPSGQQIDVWGGMIEQKSHITPYTTGTRSATQGLKDLTAKSIIDISTVSFDANAQMTFDGTDDEINTGITTQLTDFSCEVVFKNNNSEAWGRLVDKAYTNGFFVSSYFASYGAGYVGAGIVEPNPPHGQALQYDTSKYNYFVVTRSGTTHTIYLNGSTNSLSKTGSSATLGTAEMAIGAWYGSTSSQRFTGEIPVVKLYNRALTADEVARNYNAIKSRFNIG